MIVGGLRLFFTTWLYMYTAAYIVCSFIFALGLCTLGIYGSLCLQHILL